MLSRLYTIVVLAISLAWALWALPPVEGDGYGESVREA